jgi:hypothetical protein
MKINLCPSLAALVIGSTLAFSPVLPAAEKDMRKDAKGMMEKGAMKDDKGMMKDQKGMMEDGKDAKMKDKMKSEKTSKSASADKMKMEETKE